MLPRGSSKFFVGKFHDVKIKIKIDLVDFDLFLKHFAF